jgi:hypothetical protein
MKPFLAVPALALTILIATPAAAWDSESWQNFTHPTHTYLTEYGIANSGSQTIRDYAAQIIEGANTELHELVTNDDAKPYGIPLEAKRIEHKGSNSGTNDILGWWGEAQAARSREDFPQAFFYIGIMLHMIEDMGVPAHALGHYHQKFLPVDHFEWMAFFNWKPNYADQVNRRDPLFDNPSDYYKFSQDWTLTDARGYRSSQFSRTWLFASKAERKLLANRQDRTRRLVAWTLRSVARVWHLP